ncbi:MAG: hypothetical protein IKS43_07130, partial [Clostridia bacterium]|nr:hypothetical protein [Clostridia bacterium]
MKKAFTKTEFRRFLLARQGLTGRRRRAFAELYEEGLITPVRVKGIPAPLFIKSADIEELRGAEGFSPDRRRCEPLA